MDSPRPTKRQRLSGTISPITPISPPEVEDATSTTTTNSLTLALHVLQTEAAALANLTTLYKTSPQAQHSLQEAITTILRAKKSGGKLILCGVGKSSYIAQKLTATCKSLGIPSSFMHACEAAHGDLGDIRSERGDVVLFVSFSGKTPELLNLLPHIPPEVTVVAMSSHLEREECLLLRARDEERGILLPAPIPVKEEVSFGVSAPTTSTTVALAVADMLALAVADEMHRGKTREVFLKNHPGGAIGITHREVEEVKKAKLDVSIVELPSPSISAESED
ncbi:hypothetical protein M409DRAFT_18371 [Zasmidium cellare ATCC 36951]|uniref:SIS domain-containing protein n=1 Tax=Zasmidium cellare ATCC 36951 TaxID=1080233 RepID=A0A6A6CW42_ZASCE|nr:uncharacterized protein M409DRAFT_18371 [Zasmidium cellare ATCC 36951]KAF2171255.1 hypothetical protein M409DRAFT_18371 [Zasmidium cellare ATCC 36951]